jgi:hypothetical protein
VRRRQIVIGAFRILKGPFHTHWVCYSMVGLSAFFSWPFSSAHQCAPTVVLSTVPRSSMKCFLHSARWTVNRCSPFACLSSIAGLTVPFRGYICVCFLVRGTVSFPSGICVCLRIRDVPSPRAHEGSFSRLETVQFRVLFVFVFSGHFSPFSSRSFPADCPLYAVGPPSTPPF